MSDSTEDPQVETDALTVLEGRISITAALRGRSRPLRAIYLARGRDPRETASLRRAADEAGVPLVYEERTSIDARAQGTRHGGVIAVAGERVTVPLEDLLPAKGIPFVVMIDGVEDPYNFGSAVRSLYAAGVDGLVVRPRNWLTAAGIVARASAGASELLPVAIAETAMAAADTYSRAGLCIACATSENATSIYESDLTAPLFLLVGGEQRGITRSFVRGADLRLRVPYARRGALDLGTAAATAVIGFEVMRQRAEKVAE